MSDPRAVYEGKISAATYNYNAVLSHAVEEYRMACSQAWYDYQEATGMISREDQGSAEHSNGSGADTTGGPGREPAARPEQPIAGQDCYLVGGFAGQDNSHGGADAPQAP